jgi:hypothetical protein
VLVYLALVCTVFAFWVLSRSPSRGARDVLRVWVGAGWGG